MLDRQRTSAQPSTIGVINYFGILDIHPVGSAQAEGWAFRGGPRTVIAAINHVGLLTICKCAMVHHAISLGSPPLDSAMDTIVHGAMVDAHVLLAAPNHNACRGSLAIYRQAANPDGFAAGTGS